MTQSSAFPEWVYKRDGRLAPFERDKISQALFAAAEAISRGDAFLARELADGVLHFLGRECAAGAIPTTAQIADLAVKVVRELGHPELARAFAHQSEQRRLNPLASSFSSAPAMSRPVARRTVSFQFSPLDAPDRAVRDRLRAYGLHAIFSRDLVAAVADGWLTFPGLEAPLALAGGVVDLPALSSRRPGALAPFGRFVVIDGPEHAAPADVVTKSFAEMIAEAGSSRGRTLIVNVNGAAPSASERHPAGPLFAERGDETGAAMSHALLQQILDGSFGQPGVGERLRINWRLSERDFRPDPPCRARLIQVARLALDAPHVELVFDRPRRPLVLAEGVDRRQPAVLQEAAVHLPRLLGLPGVSGDPQRFVLKLPSLAHMAISAGVQKRNFLRRQKDVSFREFLLDRARLVVVPVGLEAVVRTLSGQALCASTPALELGCQIVASLDANLRSDGRAANLDACVDSACWSPHAGRAFSVDETADEPLSLEKVAGVTPWDSTAPLKMQIQAAGRLHAAAGGWGTAALFVPDRPLSANEVTELLEYAYKQTETVRLRFVRLAARQARLAW